MKTSTSAILLSFPPHAKAVFRSGRSGLICTDITKFSRHSSGATPLLIKFYQCRADGAAEHGTVIVN